MNARRLLQKIISDMIESSQVDIAAVVGNAENMCQLEYYQGYQAALATISQRLKAAGYSLSLPPFSIIQEGITGEAQTNNINSALGQVRRKLIKEYDQALDKSSQVQDYDLEYVEGQIEGLGFSLALLEALILSLKQPPASSRPRQDAAIH